MACLIDSLTFEHHRSSDTIGIGNPTPRISWKVYSDEPSWIQTSYEIHIFREGAENQEIYKVESSDSVLVPWPSTPLRSGESALVRVRATGSPTNRATEWSKDATIEAVVEVGLLDRNDWGNTLLIKSPLVHAPSESKTPIRFRKEFFIPKVVTKARLYVTAHGVYEAQINGKLIMDHVMAPGWQSYSHRHAYQTFDVTESITQGGNAIGVYVGEGWYSGRLGFNGGARNIYGDSIGLIAKLVVSFSDGTALDVGTGPGWKASAGEIISSEIYDGESVDLRHYTDGWTASGFDDSSWKDAETADLPSVRLVAPSGPPVREMHRLQFKTKFRSPSRKLLFDFGQNLVGRLRIKLPQGLKEGSTLTLSHAEVLENGELGTRPLRIAKCTDSLIFAEGTGLTYWEPKFTFHGFRYAHIDGFPTDHIGSDDIQAIVLHTGMERTGYFECSDPLLNRLHENIVWGMRGNFLSIPTDCPQRDERLGWTGDLAVFAPTANYLYDTAGMLKDWLKDVRLEQLADAHCAPPLVVPDVLAYFTDRKSTAVWGDVTTLVPWELFQAFGDSQILKDQYESIDSWLSKAVARDETGLWATDGERSMQLGDWLDPKAPPDDPGNSVTDRYLVADAFLVRSTEIAASISSILGFHDKAKRYEAEVSKLKAAFQEKYITPLGRVVSDSQTAYALALHFSLFATPAQVEVAGARLCNLVRESAKFNIATGFAGTPYISHALSKIGESQLFYRMLFHKNCPSWLYQVKMGATTMWERWDSMLPDGSINPGEMTSFNHYALGAVGDWMHKVIGGISPLEPGWKKFKVAPIPGAELTSAKVKFESPYGLIKSEWWLTGDKRDKFILRVTVPPNSEAEVQLPGEQTSTLVRSGKHNFESEFVPKAWPPKPIYALLQNYSDEGL